MYPFFHIDDFTNICNRCDCWILAGSNQLGEVEEAAYDWVEDTFQTKMLIADKSGNFKTNTGSAMKLD